MSRPPMAGKAASAAPQGSRAAPLKCGGFASEGFASGKLCFIMDCYEFQCIAGLACPAGSVCALCKLINKANMTVDQQTVDISQFTLNDIHVGSRLYTALVAHAHATQAAPVFYSDLLEQAKQLDPEDAELQRAVPVGIGMKLLFVEAFCVTNAYPNLACLAVSRARGRPGDGYKGDWEADKRAVAEFDWSTAQPKLDAYVLHARLVVTPKKRRSDDEARTLRWEHYSANRQAYAGWMEEEKMEMLNLLIDGFAPEAAYRRVVAARMSMQEGK